MEYVKFPKRLKIKTKNPIIDFYCKCLKLLGKSENLQGFDVTKVFVNPKDYAKLRKNLEQHVKVHYSGFKKKYRDSQVAMFLLQYGPCEKNSVPTGIVYIDYKNLYQDVG